MQNEGGCSWKRKRMRGEERGERRRETGETGERRERRERSEREDREEREGKGEEGVSYWCQILGELCKEENLSRR